MEGDGLRNMPLILILLILLLQASAAAADWNPDVLPKSMPAFLLGFAGGIALHEAGHLAVASSRGYQVHTEGVSLVYSPDFASRRDQLRISTAGFQAQWLASEAAFHYRAKAPDLTAGIITSHLAITAAYLTVLKDHPKGDLVGASHASGLTTGQLILIATIPAVLDGWRLFGTDVPAWVAPLSMSYKGGCLAAAWTY